MAIVFTYTTLENQVLAYLERNDIAVVDQVPVFITLAQDRLSRDIKTLILETYFNGTFVAGESRLIKPALWRNTVTFNVGVGDTYATMTMNPVILKSYEFCRLYWPDPNQTGVPKYYADYGPSHWLVVPTPDLAYKFEIAMQGAPTILDENNQTNVLTQSAFRLLFYASLLEAMLYVKDDERINSWQTMYVQALEALNAEDAARGTDRYADRTKD